jgi:drug/metabolite transporter (DMT)-like permease
MLSIILGFLGYSVLNVSQASQKIGLVLAQTKRVQGRLIWVSATFGTLASSFLVLAAVALGSASLVGAMAGAGLASLAVFSHFVMKERIGRKEAAGVIVIILAAALIGIFSEENPPSLLRLDYLFGMLTLLIVAAAALLFALRRKKNILGLLIGAFSGILGGFVPLFQKVSTSDLGKSISLFPAAAGTAGDPFQSIVSMFSNPFTLAWILLSLASMIVLQFAYKKAPVIKIIPFFSASCIVIPVLGGVICLGERLHALQWVGVALILGGLILLTVRGRRTDDTAPTKT